MRGWLTFCLSSVTAPHKPVSHGQPLFASCPPVCLFILFLSYLNSQGLLQGGVWLGVANNKLTLLNK